MNEVKYQIFVSSTYKDLIIARETVLKTILGLYQFPIGMEMFSADDDEQWEVIKETIDISDYYILILGHRYGSETNEGISYTEKEFDYAKQIGVPILSFIRDRKAPTTPDERESDPEKIKKLEAFLAKASSSKMCDFWLTEEQLASKVAVALSKFFMKTPRIGWIRSDKGMSIQVSEELARLSKENRDIKDELDAYREKISSRVPNIKIRLESNSDEEFVLKPLDALGYSELAPLEIHESLPDHLSQYVSKEDIDKYNTNLPTASEIDDFNKRNQFFHRIINGVFDVVIKIENSGNSPANEVLVDLRFPKELLVLKEYDWKNIEEPEISIPDNPIKKAEEKYKRVQKIKTGFFSTFDQLTKPSTFSRDFMTPSLISPMSNLASSINRNTWCNIEDNEVHIRIKKLIHTRQTSFDEIKFIPFASGTHKISVSVICEEFETSNDFEIEVEIK